MRVEKGERARGDRDRMGWRGFGRRRVPWESYEEDPASESPSQVKYGIPPSHVCRMITECT